MDGREILAMTGSTPHLCNQIGLMDVGGLQRRDAPEGAHSSCRSFCVFMIITMVILTIIYYYYHVTFSVLLFIL